MILKNVFITAAFLFLNYSLTAQIKGVLKDSISGTAIAYATISIENESLGTTSDEDGTFIINDADKNKNLIISVLGYETKKIKAYKAEKVFLKRQNIALNEVVIVNKKETKQIEIGQLENPIYQAFENTPRIEAKFFPYIISYKKTKFIKKVSVFTDSKIDVATIKIHFYEVNENGLPGNELIDKNLIVTVKKGQNKTYFDVSDYNITIPKNGLFVGIERLIIERNKLEKTVVNPIDKTTKNVKTYAPLTICAYISRPFMYNYIGGVWTKKTKSSDPKSEIMVYEPAINLVLSN